MEWSVWVDGEGGMRYIIFEPDIIASFRKIASHDNRHIRKPRSIGTGNLLQLFLVLYCDTLSRILFWSSPPALFNN